MESKKQAVTRLYKDYFNCYQQVTLYPAANYHPENMNYDSENNNLWQGEGAILLRLNNLFSNIDWLKWISGIANNEVYPGLFARHPRPYTAHEVSWDEQNGICYASVALEYPAFAESMVKYGKDHDWIYVDSLPGTRLFWPLKNIFKYISYRRQPRDSFFYKVCGDIKPNWFETLWFAGSAFLSVFGGADKTSGKIMTFFCMKALELKGYNNWLVKCAYKFVRNYLTKLYGTEYYLSELFKIYFKDTNHPFHTLAKNIK